MEIIKMNNLVIILAKIKLKKKWIFLKNMADFSQLKKFKEKLLMPFKPKGKSK
jgi:hypothetical protein